MKLPWRLTIEIPLLALVACEAKPEQKPIPPLPALTQQSASNFAQITLKCVQKEYPNSPGLVLNAVEDVQAPNTVHPSFYGCYDWHSSVHGHWMLARLLRLFPNLPEKDQIVRALDTNLTRKTSRPRRRTSIARARKRSSGPTAGRGR